VNGLLRELQPTKSIDPIVVVTPSPIPVTRDLIKGEGLHVIVFGTQLRSKSV